MFGSKKNKNQLTLAQGMDIIQQTGDMFAVDKLTSSSSWIDDGASLGFSSSWLNSAYGSDIRNGRGLGIAYSIDRAQDIKAEQQKNKNDWWRTSPTRPPNREDSQWSVSALPPNKHDQTFNKKHGN